MQMWPTFFGITRTSHISVYSCTTSVHADSPPPKTLISYGARDWVQTSTSPNEISFWVQVRSRLIWKTKHYAWKVGHRKRVSQWALCCKLGAYMYSMSGCCLKKAAVLYLLLCTARWPFLQTNSRGCGYIESQSQTSDPVVEEIFFFLGEPHERDIFVGKASAKLGGNPHVSPGTPPAWVSRQQQSPL